MFSQDTSGVIGSGALATLGSLESRLCDAPSLAMAAHSLVVWDELHNRMQTMQVILKNCLPIEDRTTAVRRR